VKAATNLTASVRQRLLNLANENRQDFGMLLTKFALERFLHRLSVSRHRDSFVLKGRFFCNCGLPRFIARRGIWTCWET
jgi:hypothetical protein